MNFYKWCDTWMDKGLFELSQPTLDKLKDYWDNQTILSSLIIILIFWLVILTIQHTRSHKRMCSKAYWRGWRECEKTIHKTIENWTKIK
jgi:hypothetical protein